MTKIIAITIASCLLTGCANMQAAYLANIRVSCLTWTGQPVPPTERTKENCTQGQTFAEQRQQDQEKMAKIWGSLYIPQGDLSVGTASSQTVILPQGVFTINRVGTTTSIHQVSRTGK